MKILQKKFFLTGALVCSLACGIGTAGAQDLTGGWAILIHEDFPERIPGPDIAEYAGLPISAAARYAALAWDPAQLAMPVKPASSELTPTNPAAWRFLRPPLR